MSGLYEQLTGPIRRLHHITRYSSMPILHQENVAEHSWDVTFICLLIYLDQKGLFQDAVSAAELEEKGIVYDHLDLELLMTRAPLHDISESISGDIIRSFKYSTKRLSEEIKDADDKNTYRMTRTFGRAGDEIYLGWRNAKTMADDRNCELIAFADVVSVVIKCAEEKWLGNQHMDAVCERAYEKHMRGLAEKHPWLWRYVLQLFPDSNYQDIYRQPPLVTDGDFQEEAQ